VSGGLGRIEPVGNVLVAYAARDGTTALDGDRRNSPLTAVLLRNIETPGVGVTFVFRNVRDDVMEATRNEQQPFVYGSLSRKAIYLAAPPPPDSVSTTQANAMPAVAAPASPALATSATAIDPALVGTWEIMVPSGRSQSRWIWTVPTSSTPRAAAPRRHMRARSPPRTAAGRCTRSRASRRITATAAPTRSTTPSP
jgi:hypothetical protein